MFYLKHFFQIIKQNPIRTVVFFILTSALFFTAGHREFVRSSVGVNQTPHTSRPYFHALISSKQNSAWIARKLRELPGVEAVELLPSNELNQQVKELLSGMDSDIVQAVGSLELAGLKVVAKPELEERSITLIKDYLTRLAGSETTVGATVLPTKLQRTKKFTWQSWIAEIITSFLLFLWIGSIVLLSKPIRRSAYLIEQFQRRRNVAMKTWGAAATMSIAVGLVSTYAWKPPEIVPVLICLILAALSTFYHVRRSSWEG